MAGALRVTLTTAAQESEAGGQREMNFRGLECDGKGSLTSVVGAAYTSARKEGPSLKSLGDRRHGLPLTPPNGRFHLTAFKLTGLTSWDVRHRQTNWSPGTHSQSMSSQPLQH